MATVPGVPRTWVAGEVVTAALLNAQIRDATAILLDPPRMSARATTAQSIPNGAFAAIALQTEVEDADNMFTPGGSSVTVKTPGRWLFSYLVPWVSNPTGGRLAGLFVNGGEVYRAFVQAVNGHQTHVTAATVLRCAVGDVVGLYGWQNSGAALSTLGAGGDPVAQMQAQWLSK